MLLRMQHIPCAGGNNFGATGGLKANATRNLILVCSCHYKAVDSSSQFLLFSSIVKTHQINHGIPTQKNRFFLFFFKKGLILGAFSAKCRLCDLG
jgi:hypothetical protein